jgi:hypothetical protein
MRALAHVHTDNDGSDMFYIQHKRKEGERKIEREGERERER